MVKVTGPTGTQAPASATPEEVSAKDPAKVAATPAKPASDAFAQAAGGLLGYKSSALVSGAVKIFSDGVMFPQTLVDPQDPRNDPKYLRLLAAVLGMDELEHYFFSLEGEKQEEYLTHKAKQREEKLAKVQREKEEKRRQKEQGAVPEAGEDEAEE